MSFRRSILCLVILLACLAKVKAQQPGFSNGDWQFWPEVNLSVALNEKVSFVALGTLHFGLDVSDLNEEQLGVGLNFFLNKHFSLSPSYRYIRGQPPGGSHTEEHRFLLDFVARAPLRNKFLVSDRNRGELRRINGVDSGRYRNRLQLERSFHLIGRKVVPYLADEVFYDSRYHIWNRNRIYAGARISLVKHFGVDGCYLEQHDVRDRPFTRRHVLDLSLKIEY